jgi:hypothetical protein
MSALPAQWTELSESPRMDAMPVPAQRRTDRRAEQKVLRRSRQRWAVAGCSILAASFGCTVGILDVLH